ncbi:flagellar biosynthesis protein FlhF [Alteromonas sediminis]|uniref:Flagellar biosynthesis protein FlhF n=1 Tax=Alteromonas sediminis TaxID=2259342 RepID=A0A3N5Y919_9ALTE|nr:flagellar biosynthesis protein FlhF [Alteromonas sediminis]RPJ65015.1 flagellar biosynthesis protein FlhF [Alteromonas sediminis]
MKIRRFFGKDMREALRLVKEELGEEAVIMSNRKVADGVELVAAFDKEPAPQFKPAATSTKTMPSLSDIIGESGPDSLKALLEIQKKKQAEAKSAKVTPTDASNVPPKQNPDIVQPPHVSQVNKPETPTNDAPRTAQDLEPIKEELASLRHMLQHQVADLMDAKRQRQKPMHAFISKQLVGMGLSYTLANQLADFVPSDANERESWRYVLQLMVNRLSLHGNQLLSQTGAAAFVGPTGTGKTTTIAKLAARYAQKYGPDSVALVTVDTYRIGAFEQLQTYGKIIGCIVRQAQNAQALADLLFQLRHKRMIFIDTAGFSQRDSRLISQLEQFNNPTMSVKRYLVLQANTQYPALERCLEAYKGLNMDGCVLTKLDECYSLGEALSVAIEQQLPLSFVTDGQQVPEDIKPADAKSLVTIAAKLYKKYGLSHTNNHNPITTTQAV